MAVDTGQVAAQTAQQTNQDAGHTVGDALNAYHIASTAENARQELEMEKSNHDMNRMNWVAQQVKAIQGTTGPARQMLADSFGKQLSKVVPEANLDFVPMLAKDPEYGQSVLNSFSNIWQGKAQPDDIKNGLTALSAATPDQRDFFEKQSQSLSQERAAQLKAAAMAQGQQGRVGAMQDTATQAAGDKFDKDNNILKLVPMGQALGRDAITLQNTDPKNPVTYQTLHESLMNVANVLGSGSLSDARVSSITPPSSDETAKKIEQFLSKDPNQPADPKYINYVQHLVGRLNGAINGDVADRANAIGNSRDASLFHNPSIAAITKSKQQFYASGAWRNQNAAPPVGQRPDSGGAPAGATQVNPDSASLHPPMQMKDSSGNVHIYNWNPTTRKYE